ncbi:MAG TPA: trypsin-like peptidase domain-containing protein [Bryobacteraceae bacterium]|nr:trypsin-like peptidase domain-containing protein [Bryobacteraceae bacterium]
MKRVFWFSFFLVAAFALLTARTEWGQKRLFSGVRTVGTMWSGPESVHSAGLTPDEQNNIDIYRTAHLATVNITSTVYQRSFFFDVYPSKDTGSGFFIDGDGRILTNNHVIADATRIEVTLPDQSHYKARLLDRDPVNDLALLKITPKKPLPFLRLGDSDSVLVGQKVLAIGNPFGLDGTLTTGIVSSLGRNIQAENGRQLEGLIQTDAAINPGNSGGPLLDSHGTVVAINTAIYGPQGNIGIGFAMPINRAKVMLSDFQTGRTYQPPSLGVRTVYIAGQYAEAIGLPSAGGLLILEIVPGSAAEDAGLRGGNRTVIVGNYELTVGGDLITAIDGKPVQRQDDLSRAMARKRAGDTLSLTVIRGGQTRTVKVTLGAATSDRAL